MQKFFCLYISLFFFNAAIEAESLSDQRTAILVDHLKNKEFKEGISAMVAGTILEEHDLSSLVNLLRGMHASFGDIYGFERVLSLELGKVKKITYFIYCDQYPIKLTLTEYYNGKRYHLVNIAINDNISEALDDWGEIR